MALEMSVSRGNCGFVLDDSDGFVLLNESKSSAPTDTVAGCCFSFSGSSANAVTAAPSASASADAGFCLNVVASDANAARTMPSASASTNAGCLDVAVSPANAATSAPRGVWMEAGSPESMNEETSPVPRSSSKGKRVTGGFDLGVGSGAGGFRLAMSEHKHSGLQQKRKSMASRKLPEGACSDSVVASSVPRSSSKGERVTGGFDLGVDSGAGGFHLAMSEHKHSAMASRKLPEGARSNSVVMVVAEPYYTQILQGQKRMEIRANTPYWDSRLRAAKWVEFQKGYNASTRLMPAKILDKRIDVCDELLERKDFEQLKKQRKKLFGDADQVIVIEFEQPRKPNVNSSLASFKLVSARTSAGSSITNSGLPEAFAWPRKLLSALPAALNCSAACLGRSLLGRRVRLSTHCSGIGAPEIAAGMLMANSAVLGFDLNIQFMAACDADAACRGLLLAQSADRHVFSDIFEFFPGWDRKVRAPDATVGLLKSCVNVRQSRTCWQHQHACEQPAVEGDICGSPCQPWSRAGKGMGAKSEFGFLLK